MYEELTNTLDEAFTNHDYENVIKITAQIVSIPSEITSDNALKCLIALKKLNTNLDAIPKLEKIINLNKNRANYKLYMGKMYHKHHLYVDAKAILLEAILEEPTKNDPLAYSYLGKTCLDLGELSEGKSYLTKSLELDPHSKFAPLVKNLLDKAENKDNMPSHKIPLVTFLASNHTLAPGYIVYLKSTSKVKNNVPYLIFRLKKDTIYGFALNLYPTKDTYHIKKETNKAHLDFYLSGRIALFTLDDIENIRTHISVDLLPIIMENLALYYVNLNLLEDPRKRELLTYIKTAIKSHSIIKLKPRVDSEPEYYLVTQINPDNYEAQKLIVASSKFQLTDIKVIIDKHTFIPSIINLSLSSINKIITNQEEEQPSVLKLTPPKIN